MTGTPFAIIDAFTAEPFGGNPAAVVRLDAPAADDWMQRVAAEFGFSETAFVRREGEAWWLRWFTPTVEVTLCGHATLATTRALADAGEPGPFTFLTRSGSLICDVEDDGRVTMDFPADVSDRPVDLDRVAAAIGLPVLRAGEGREFVVAEIADVDGLDALAPDLAQVARLGATGLVVTTASETPGAAVASRMFAPQSGIDEDPVTGAAHCALAPWWADRAGTRFTAEQRSARGGRVEVELTGDRVVLRGHATVVASGHLVPRAAVGEA